MSSLSIGCRYIIECSRLSRTTSGVAAVLRAYRQRYIPRISQRIVIAGAERAKPIRHIGLMNTFSVVDKETL